MTPVWRSRAERGRARSSAAEERLGSKDQRRPRCTSGHTGSERSVVGSLFARKRARQVVDSCAGTSHQPA
jgi:hypothetical protein